MNPIYSIIIPHYKTRSTLQRCLESIPLCDDVEAIVVDDASGFAISDMPMNDNPYVHYIMLEKTYVERGVFMFLCCFFSGKSLFLTPSVHIYKCLFHFLDCFL